MLASGLYGKGARAQSEIEFYELLMILQRAMIGDEITVIVASDLFEDPEKRDRNRVIGTLFGPALLGIPATHQQILPKRDKAWGRSFQVGASMGMHEDLGFEPTRENPICPHGAPSEQKTRRVEMGSQPFEGPPGAPRPP